MTFDPKQHLINLKGKDYLEAKWRLVWLRDAHGTDASVTTELVLANEATIVFKATIAIGGAIVATAHGSAPTQGKGSWAGREMEKAETASVSRALAHAGFGTQFAGEDVEEGEDRLSDSPVQRKSPLKQLQDQNAQQRPSEMLWSADDQIKRLFTGNYDRYKVWLREAFEAGVITADVNIHELKKIILEHSDQIVLGAE